MKPPSVYRYCDAMRERISSGAPFTVTQLRGVAEAAGCSERRSYYVASALLGRMKRSLAVRIVDRSGKAFVYERVGG